MKTKMITITYK